MPELKTFLFTDIVGSVELKAEMPGRSDTERDQAYVAQILTPHREHIERELAALGGRVVSTAGDGHFLVFSDTISAARWAIGIQQAHRDAPIHTPKGARVGVRVSIHLGVPQIDPRDADNFVGKAVDYTARLNDYATSGQILASRSVVAVLEDAGMEGATFHRHGRRMLRGIGQVDVYELVYDRLGPRPMRDEPQESLSRQWTVLPATMGLTEFHAGRRGAGAGGEAWGGERPAGSGARAGEPPAPATDVVPLRLGNYELEERLGSGGMGDVFKARHAQFGRVRAVKVIKQHFVEAGHHEVIRRFYREIKAVGALEHPNIVVAIDSSLPSDTVHYLVMEYIDGVGADELVGRMGPLPVPEACEIARQAALGLAYIHDHGMVHRDIKPSNLMITRVPTSSVSGTPSSDEQAVVKILDLGLALLVGDDEQRLTLFDHRAMGTAMYMSPEQWKSTTVDIRADIYSLGCTLYHLLAGKPPFWESDLKPEKAHEREKLPPIRSNEAVPGALWNVLRRMTAKNPDERYEHPREVAEALAPLAAGHRLEQWIDKVTGTRSATQGMSKTDTLVAQSAESDTRAGRASSAWRLSKSLPPVARRRLWRGLMAVLVVAATASIGWLIWEATGRRASVQQALDARQDSLQVGARFAASEILKEINSRFDILRRLAANETLHTQLAAINERPDDEQLWNELEEWLKARNMEYEKEVPADSWFINTASGVQVARSPRSDASRGENYSHRDYFHGQGAAVDEDATDLAPIREPHLSAVYRSTSTGHLKVAFSVPIEARVGGQRQTLGVLAMAVDLGEFNVLEKQLPRGHEVVLIDLREAAVDDQLRRGLVLHHQAESAYREGNPPPWIDGALLARIDRLLVENPGVSAGAIMLTDYSDDALTDGRTYWGAMRPVIDRRPDGQVFDARWLVLVQEPLQR